MKMIALTALVLVSLSAPAMAGTEDDGKAKGDKFRNYFNPKLESITRQTGDKVVQTGYWPEEGTYIIQIEGSNIYQHMLLQQRLQHLKNYCANVYSEFWDNFHVPYYVITDTKKNTAIKCLNPR